MSRVIRLPSQLCEEVYQHIETNNLGDRRTMSLTKAITTLLSIAMYETPHIKDGRELSGRLLDNTSPMLKGSVAKWAKQTDWNAIQSRTGIPEEIQKELSRRAQKIDPEFDIEVSNKLCLRETPLESTRPKVSLKDPPWELIERIDLESIQKVYPLHHALVWIYKDKDDPLRKYAVECAFAKTPKSMYKAAKLMEMVYDFYQRFKEWKGENDDERED